MISEYIADLLLAEFRERPASGRLLTLQQESASITMETLETMAAQHEVPFRWPRNLLARLFLPPDRRGDRTVFSALGFDETLALGTDVSHDLNSADVSPELVGRFDTILDNDTLKCQFHVPNAFASIRTMLRPGGRVIHIATYEPMPTSPPYGTPRPALFEHVYKQIGWQMPRLVLLMRNGEADWRGLPLTTVCAPPPMSINPHDVVGTFCVAIAC